MGFQCWEGVKMMFVFEHSSAGLQVYSIFYKAPLPEMTWAVKTGWRESNTTIFKLHLQYSNAIIVKILSNCLTVLLLDNCSYKAL